MAGIFKKILFLFCALAVAQPIFAASNDACKEAKQLWQERMTYDINARKARLTLDQKIIANKMKRDDVEKKIIAVEEEILASPSDKRQLLWKKMDDLSQEKETLSIEVMPVQKEYSALGYERALKRTDLKNKWFAKQYECIVNEPLNIKLVEFVKKLDRSKKFTDKDRETIRSLVSQRAELIESLKKEYEKKEQDINAKFGEYKKIIDETNILLKKEDELDEANDKTYDAVYELFDRLGEVLDKGSDDISNLSGQLMTYIEMK